MNLVSGLNVVSNGVSVSYGRFPSGLLPDWNGIVFWFTTTDCYSTEAHEIAVKPLIEQLKDDNDDKYSRWVQTKIEAVVWKPYNQTTLVSFRVRDAY
jgi:hypothetical protein